MSDQTSELIAADSLEERGLVYLARILRGQVNPPAWLMEILSRGLVHGDEVPIQVGTPCRLHVGGHSFGPLFLVDVDSSAQIIARNSVGEFDIHSQKHDSPI